MEQRPTMTDLAARLGVSPSTVSRALRNDSRISVALREKVKAAAEESGYLPNPMVSALMATRRKGGAGEVDTVALVTDYHGAQGWQEKDVCCWEYEGVLQRATELGFRLEIFALQDYGNDTARLEKTLFARGIRGVLLGFSRGGERRGMLSPKHFAIAGLSAYFRDVVVDRANFHGMFNVRLALEHMVAKGYRRTGLIAPEFNNRISGYQWSGSFLDFQRQLDPGRRCTPFLHGDGDFAREFAAWLKAEKPDSLLVYKTAVRQLLSKAGLRIPQDLGVAYLFRTADEMDAAAGIDGNLRAVGAAAFDLVVERLTTNRRGVPQDPKEVLIKGRWQDGPTLPAKT
ncbi:LacI family DNA-binding transcriptional regulator [Luteolibacter soli]